MSKIKNGILGGFCGKVEKIVGALWNGVDYIRSQVKSVNIHEKKLSLYDA